MTKNLNIAYKVGLFILLNIATSILLINKEWLLGGENVLFGPFIYGFLVGLFCLNDKKNQLLKSFVLGLGFLLIFLVSSFGMLFTSKKLFGADDFVPMLSTPFSVLLIVLLINQFKELKNKSLVIITMVAVGLSSTYIGDYFSQTNNETISKVFFNVFFLWQVTTGTILILGLEKN